MGIIRILNKLKNEITLLILAFIFTNIAFCVRIYLITSIRVESYIRIISLICGFLLFIYSIYSLLLKLIQFVLNNVDYKIDKKALLNTIYRKKVLEKGPHIVAIGGGTGLSTMLRGLKNITSNITAVVTVADDGGGSGIIREDLGLLPPGDIRNCILALANTEEIMQKLLNYRFKDGRLKGQNFGNLFLAAMTGVAGSFEKAVKLMSDVLAVRGKVLPVTLDNVKLCAKLDDNSIIIGESKIPEEAKNKACRIQKVFLLPENAKVFNEVIEEINKADVIIIGPGSLYTSILPNLLFNEVVDSIKKSKAKKIYIANIMTQPGETDNYSLSDHIKAIEGHCGKIFDIIIANNGEIPFDLKEKYENDGAIPVIIDDDLQNEYIVISENIVSTKNGLIRHSPNKLSSTISKVIFGEDIIAKKRLYSINNYLIKKLPKKIK
ncbi:uridine diphosphate-N-acetylglucosamine-binding protein YvcK [Caldicellulosiruptoraceae bacterium PP1]